MKRVRFKLAKEEDAVLPDLNKNATDKDTFPRFIWNEH